MIFIAGIFLLLLSGLSYSFFKELIAPAVCFPIMWAFVLMLHPICQLTVLPYLYDISLQTLFVVLAGNSFFVFGGFFYIKFSLLNQSFTKTKYNLTSTGKYLFPVKIGLRLFLLFIVISLLPVYINLSLAIAIKAGAESLLTGLRNELTQGDIDIGPIKYMQPFSIVTYAICEVDALRRPNAKNRTFAILAFLAACVYAFFNTGRTLFFILILLSLGLRIILKKNFSILRNLWILPTVVIVFGLYGLVYNKGGSTDRSIRENMLGIAEFTAIYLVTPITAFDLVTKPPFEPVYEGYRVFRFFYSVGNKLGITNVSNDRIRTIQEFVAVPYEGNVFTVFGPYGRDFGPILSLPFLFIFGWLHTYLFKKAISTRSTNFSIYYALSLFPLAMSIFDDEYLSILSFWLQSIILIEGILFINKALYLFQSKYKLSL